MAASRGFNQAIKRLDGIAKRASDPSQGWKAIGRMIRARHEKYYRTHIGELTSIGGGPPGDPWRGLSPNTADAKERYGRTRKLIDTGVLRRSYQFIAQRGKLLFYNTQATKVANLQNELGYTVVATDLKKQDPALYQQILKAAREFLFKGKS